MEKFTPLAKILNCRRQWQQGKISPLIIFSTCSLWQCGLLCRTYQLSSPLFIVGWAAILMKRRSQVKVLWFGLVGVVACLPDRRNATKSTQVPSCIITRLNLVHYWQSAQHLELVLALVHCPRIADAPIVHYRHLVGPCPGKIYAVQGLNKMYLYLHKCICHHSELS